MTPFYDPLLAKVIAWGMARPEARRRLIAALEDTIVFGVTTNRGFLLAVLRQHAFAAGEATTSFIEKYFVTGGDLARAPQPELPGLVIAAVLLFESRSAIRCGHACCRMVLNRHSHLAAALDDRRHALSGTYHGA